MRQYKLEKDYLDLDSVSFISQITFKSLNLFWGQRFFTYIISGVERRYSTDYEHDPTSSFLLHKESINKIHSDFVNEWNNSNKKEDEIWNLKKY